MINKNISSKVFIVGANYKGKGGISSVIRGYKECFEKFNYIPTNAVNSKLANIVVLCISILSFPFRVLLQSIEIVHIHTGSYMDFYRNVIFLLIAKFFNLKVILHIHGAKFEEFYRVNRKFVRAICYKADALVSVSSYFVSMLKKYNLNSSVYLIHNSINPPILLSHDKNHAILYLTYIGAIDVRKGIFDVLNCIGVHKDQFINRIVLNIAGTGNVKAMNDIIDEYDISSIVHYYGWADEKVKQKLLSQADIFIHPSHFESFGISILEAMSYHLPIITTAVGGIIDLVENDVNGKFVDPGDIEQIYHAISFMLGNPNIRLQMGIASGNKASNFYINVIEKDIEKLYMKLMNS